MVRGDSPATELFPQFKDTLYEMVAGEAHGLSEDQLDFESDRWEWSRWSIRRNISHMASGDFRWMWVRWGAQLFPQGLPNGAELDAICESPHDRRLDENKYWDMDVLLGMVRQGLNLCWSVLATETVDSIRTKVLETPSDTLWAEHPEIFPDGVLEYPGDSSKVYLTLEASFSHRYFEYLAHLFNVQRLKKAQGLEPAVKLHFEGYMALPGWDISEP